MKKTNDFGPPSAALAAGPAPTAASAARKFQSDVLWNFSSLAVLGVSGIALNVLIGLYYDAAALGIFNQVLAVYTFFSQAAVGGIDRSALRAVAAHAHDRARVSEIVLGSALPTLLLAVLGSLAFWVAREPLATWLESPGVARGIAAATPGLFFFTLNKVLLAVVNGVRRMRAYALYQAARYLLILGGLFIALWRGIPGEELAFVFSFAEIVLFLVLVLEGVAIVSWPRTRAWLAWSREHLSYGVRGVASGMLLELNSKVDVLMIGMFLDDARVGIYSFAAMLAEGMFQLLVVLQTNYNPILAQQIERREFAALEAMVKKGKRLTYAFMAAVGVLAVSLYPVFLQLTTNKPEFAESWLSFAVLVAGIVLASGYFPFGQTLLMGNRPGWHTTLMAGMVACNVVGNWFLIQAMGIAGAAVATAIALSFSVFLLVTLVRRQIGVRL